MPLVWVVWVYVMKFMILVMNFNDILKLTNGTYNNRIMKTGSMNFMSELLNCCLFNLGRRHVKE